MPESDKYVTTVKELIFLAKGRLILSIFDFNELDKVREMKTRFMFAQPAQTLEILRTYKELGACSVMLDNYIMHNLHQAKIVNVPLRAVPNISFLDNIPRENGVNGNWIRPEDIDAYSLYIDSIEFGGQPQKREQALYRIYAKNKQWSGDLGLLVQDLNYVGDNAYLSSDQTRLRMNCQHKCTTNKNCQICYNILKISMQIPRF